MLGFVTCVWMLAFLMAVPQVAQTYAQWPDEYEDVICPLSAVRVQGGRINRSYWFADCCYWKLLLVFTIGQGYKAGSAHRPRGNSEETVTKPI